ncbi:MAG: hypothetical protein PVJ80_04345 [Gemmatimonadota bacterium]|jgi:hypothetical protein
MELKPHDHPKGFFDRLMADGYSGQVTLRLRGATELTGTVGETGNESVIIKGLAGRDFFDAYVRYDSITCVEVQTRS